MTSCFLRNRTRAGWVIDNPALILASVSPARSSRYLTEPCRSVSSSIWRFSISRRIQNLLQGSDFWNNHPQIIVIQASQQHPLLHFLGYRRSLLNHLICLTNQTCFDKNIGEDDLRNKSLPFMVSNGKHGALGYFLSLQN